MSKSNALENSYLLLLFNNTDIANVGNATGLRAIVHGLACCMAVLVQWCGQVGRRTQ